MLDKKIIQYTKEGVVEKNLVTGETRLTVLSDYAKEAKYRPPGREGQYGGRPEREAAKNTTYGRRERRAGSVNGSNEYRGAGYENTPALESSEEQAPGGNLPAGEDEGITENTFSPRGEEPALPKAGRRTFSHFPAGAGTKTKAPKNAFSLRGTELALPEPGGETAGSIPSLLGKPALPGGKSGSRFGEKFRRAGRRGRNKGQAASFRRFLYRRGKEDLSQEKDEEDNLGVQTAGAVSRAAENIRYGARGVSSLRQRRLQRAAKEAARGVRTAKSAGTAAAEAGGGAKRVFSIFRHPALIKFALSVAGIFLLLLLFCSLLGGGSVSFLGSATEHPELTAYVQQLDRDFLGKIDALKTSREQEGDVVTVEGAGSVNTDPGSLAILAVGDWTEITLTPGNKEKLAQCHAVLNTYTVYSYDEEVTGGPDEGDEITVRHTRIVVRTFPAAEKIDAFGYSDAEKAHVQEMLNLLYQVEDEAGISGGRRTLSDSVLQYRGEVSESCEQYGIPGYTSLALAVMQQESGGNGDDPMQCSECSLNTQYPQTPGGITDPAYSIQCGVQYLAGCLQAAGCQSPDDMPGIRLALQGYNFGNGYIPWALRRGGYSQENAEEFSRTEAQELGTAGYGDVDYVSHVLRYYGSVQSDSFLWPLPGHTYISSGYGSRTDPITGEAGAFHTGLDIPAPEGTPVLASADGTVILAGQNGDYGNCVIIQHADGVQTLYGHNSALLVKEGDTVAAGQAIAKVGQTGRATGPHCHFEFRVNGRHVDPAQYVKGVS